MAELADALDLGSSGATRTGSIPARRTKKRNTTNRDISDIEGLWFFYLIKLINVIF